MWTGEPLRFVVEEMGVIVQDKNIKRHCIPSPVVDSVRFIVVTKAKEPRGVEV